MKLISIVIPVLNRASLIVRTLDSIAGQNLSECSIFVVDNGSTDGTQDAVLRWAEAHRADLTLLSESQPGASAARNRGLSAVKTPWVMFFDSDDIMRPGHLEAIYNAIETHPLYDIIGFDVKHYTGKRLIFDTNPWNILFRGSMATQRWVARTGLVREADAWNENLSVWDDIELGARIVALLPLAVKIHNAPGVEWQETPESITSRERNLDRHAILSALNAIEKALPELKPVIPFKIAIVAGINYRNNPESSRALLNDAIAMNRQSQRKLNFIWHLARLRIPGITHLIRITNPKIGKKNKKEE